MHIPRLHNLSFLSVFLLISCSYQGTQNLSDTEKQPDVTIAWKTVSAPSDADGSNVDLFLVMSGSIMRQTHVGTFHGALLTPPTVLEDGLLYRDWWSSATDDIRLTRTDATHLAIYDTPMDGQTQSRDIMTLDVPAGLRIDCVDTGGCS